MRTTTRLATLLAAGVLAATATACSAPDAGNANKPPPATLPAKPSHPVTLNILDVAGNLQLTKDMIDSFAASHPDVIAKVNYSTGTAPQLAPKIQAEAQSGNTQTGLVLTGTDGLAAGLANGLWTDLSGYYSSHFPGLMRNYLPGAAGMAQLAQNKGIELVYYPSGPLLEYNPATVPNPPRTAQELLTWAQAHPGKFQYAQPANSGPGRTFLMGLPYLLGDTDPKNPDTGWAKTWSYLQELNKSVQTYPSSTTQTMKDLANGSVDIIATTTGWDINPRALGTVPATMQVTPLQGFHWVADAQYGVIPRGVDPDTLVADVQLLQWMLQPEQQAKAYDTGYFYPGPAVKDVPLTMAPQQSQDVVAKFGRPEYEQLIAGNPVENSLPADAQVAAFDKWNKTIGAGK